MARFTSHAWRRAGHAKPAVNPIACGSNPVPSPATAGALNPAPVGGHPAGQGSPADSQKIVVLVRADQDAVFRGLVRADQNAVFRELVRADQRALFFATQATSSMSGLASTRISSDL